MSHLQDVSLVHQAQKGDNGSFDMLYRRHQGRVRAIVARFAQGDDAEDLLQMVFLKAFLGLRHFRGDSAFTTWLTRIALNVGTTYLRTLHSHKNGQVRFEQQMPEPIPVTTPEDMVLCKERRQIVTQEVLELPEGMQQALWLRYMMDLSYQEIERELQVPLGTVKIWLYRGRNQLKHALKK